MRKRDDFTFIATEDPLPPLPSSSAAPAGPTPAEQQQQHKKKNEAPSAETDKTQAARDNKAPAGVDPIAPHLLATQTRGPNRRERRQDRFSDDKGFVQPRVRAYDRRSGTGRPANDQKKGGAGRGNWGPLGSELDAEQDNHTEARHEPRKEKEEKPKETPAEKEKEKEGAEKEGEAAAQPKEGEAAAAPKEGAPAKEGTAEGDKPEKPVITYKEFMQTQQAQIDKTPLPARRVVAEDWSKFTKITKKEEALQAKKTQEPKKKEEKKEGKKEGDKKKKEGKASKPKSVPLSDVIRVTGDEEESASTTSHASSSSSSQSKDERKAAPTVDFPSLAEINKPTDSKSS
jgi:hypothetical protein